MGASKRVALWGSLLASLAVVWLTASSGRAADGAATGTAPFGVWEGVQGSLLSSTDFLVDSPRHLSISDVATAPHSARFSSLAARGSSNFGYSSAAYWFRFTLRNESPTNGLWLVELDQLYVDRASLYTANGSGFDAVEGGRDVPFSKRGVRHRNSVFRVSLAAHETRPYYLRIEGDDSLAAPLSVWSPSEFAKHTASASFGFGLYYGLIFAMAVYNLFLAFVTRDRSYLTYFAAIATAHGLFSLVDSGFAFEHFWPEAPVWNKRALPLSVSMGLVASLAFCRQFLNTRQHTPRGDRALLRLLQWALVHALVSPLFPLRLAMASCACLALVACATVMGVGVAARRAGYLPARFFLFGWSLMMLGTALVALRVFGILPTGWFLDNAFRLGSGAEAVLLSFALGDRINALRGDKLRVIAEAKSRTDALNAELEQRVAQLERTGREVSVLNESLRRQIRGRTEALVERLAKGTSSTNMAPTLTPGTLVDGRYRVVSALGSGGMGAVYKVEREGDGKLLALKVLSGPHDPAGLARFAREANITTRLRHPNVVSVVDVEIAGEGLQFLVMDLVEGVALRALRDKYGNVAWAMPILAQIAEALRAVHEMGVVHRDVKPANVVVSEDAAGVARVTLVDFGVSTFDRTMSGARGKTRGELSAATDEERARWLESRASSPDLGAPCLTQTGVMVGTQRYTAPEIFDGAREAGPEADMFSFGVLAYELLLGQGPFEIDALVLRAARLPLPAPPSLGELPGLPVQSARLLELCLSPDIELRPSAGDVARALGVHPAQPGASPRVDFPDARQPAAHPRRL